MLNGAKSVVFKITILDSDCVGLIESVKRSLNKPSSIVPEAKKPEPSSTIPDNKPSNTKTEIKLPKEQAPKDIVKPEGSMLDYEMGDDSIDLTKNDYEMVNIDYEDSFESVYFDESEDGKHDHKSDKEEDKHDISDPFFNPSNVNCHPSGNSHMTGALNNGFGTGEDSSGPVPMNFSPSGESQFDPLNTLHNPSKLQDGGQNNKVTDRNNDPVDGAPFSKPGPNTMQTPAPAPIQTIPPYIPKDITPNLPPSNVTPPVNTVPNITNTTQISGPSNIMPPPTFTNIMPASGPTNIAPPQTNNIPPGNSIPPAYNNLPPAGYSNIPPPRPTNNIPPPSYNIPPPGYNIPPRAPDATVPPPKQNNVIPPPQGPTNIIPPPTYSNIPPPSMPRNVTPPPSYNKDIPPSNITQPQRPVNVISPTRPINVRPPCNIPPRKDNSTPLFPHVGTIRKNDPNYACVLANAIKATDYGLGELMFKNGQNAKVFIGEALKHLSQLEY